MKYRDMELAGLIVGIGGAYSAIGSVGIGMSSGDGCITLATVILGRYTPFGDHRAAGLAGQRRRRPVRQVVDVQSY